MSIDLTLTVRIHSSIADSYPSYIRLWYLCRNFDVSGCGIVEIDTTECAAVLGVSKRTIENCIKQGKKLYHRTNKTAPGKYTLYLKSLSTIALQRGLDTFGTVGYVTIDQLKTLRVAATEIEAIGGQKSSRYLARNGAVEDPNKNKPGEAKCKKNRPRNLVVTPEEVFEGTGLIESSREEKSSSQLSPGALIFDPQHGTLFVDHTFTHYGVSQSYIANKLHRNRRTINRRLSKTTRLQIAKNDRDTYIESQIAAEEEREYGRYIRPSRSLNCHPSIARKTYKLLTNIYYPKYELCSMKASRRKYKAIVQSLVDNPRRA